MLAVAVRLLVISLLLSEDSGVRDLYLRHRKRSADLDAIEGSSSILESPRIRMERQTKVIRHYWNPADTTPPSQDPRVTSSTPDNIFVFKHYWPLPTDAEKTDSTLIDTAVLVGLIARPDDVTSQELSVLEQGFIDAYTNVECGDRIIESVTIDTAPLSTDQESAARHRRLQDSSSDYLDVTYYFYPSYRCKKCGDDPRLFGESIDRRRQLQNGACLPPTNDDFLRSFNATIASLQSEGDLVNVVGVSENFAELEQVDCSSDLTEFEATVEVTFEGDAPPSDSELEVLEDAFVDSYNQANGLNSETCDTFFRVIRNAELTRIDDDLTIRHRSLQTNQTNRYKYNVTTHLDCRKCPPGTGVYAQGAVGRRRASLAVDQLGLSNNMKHDSRKLQETLGVCVCPVGNPEERAPTEEEFESVYNENIVFLRNEGQVTTVISVTEVIEPESDPSGAVVLYENDFEAPNFPNASFLSPTCPLLDHSITVDQMYDGNFNQDFTVETVFIGGLYNEDTPYDDPDGTAGQYAIGMLSSIENDRLALGFDTLGKSFVNVTMDISSIEMFCCLGSSCGPIADPVFRVSLIDDPNGIIPTTGNELSSANMMGPAGPNPWTYRWTTNSVLLDTTGSTNGRVSVVWHLLQSSYGVFDNLVVEALDSLD